MADSKGSGNSAWAWLGRQVGHLKTAIQHDPVQGVQPPPTVPPTAPPQQATDDAKVTQPQAEVVYRADQVEELPHPTNPQLKLRRTVIDEVIVDPKKKD